jgi:hypothetical protein
MGETMRRYIASLSRVKPEKDRDRPADDDDHGAGHVSPDAP